MLVPCPRCRRFYKVKKCGVTFEEGMPGADNQWQSYKLWNGDLYECEGCGAQVIVGVASQPIGEHYQPDYAKKVDSFRPLCRIDDCPGAFKADVAAALAKEGTT